MRRSGTALVGVAVGLVGGAALVRRRGAQRERIDLYFEDGSMVSLSNGTPAAERLLPIARDLLRRPR